MSAKEENRIFVGGLSWDTTERRLEGEFGRFGKVIEAQVLIVRSSFNFFQQLSFFLVLCVMLLLVIEIITYCVFEGSKLQGIYHLFNIIFLIFVCLEKKIEFYYMKHVML